MWESHVDGHISLFFTLTHVLHFNYICVANGCIMNCCNFVKGYMENFSFLNSLSRKVLFNKEIIHHLVIYKLKENISK